MTQSLVLRGTLERLPDINRSFRVWGIDLGTTNSTVTEIRWSPTRSTPMVRCLVLEQETLEGVYESPLVPSVVAILPDGRVWIGEGAKRLRTRPSEAGLMVERNLFYDTKNEMGLRKTYAGAAEGFNQPWKIAAHILEFIKQKAEQATGSMPDRVIVSVPASFHLNQRSDTLRAAGQAGLELSDYELLDEPLAALIAYLLDESAKAIIQPGKATRVLVFDFGGGTCDVSIVQLETDARNKHVAASLLMTSRYHRLGGGDIDAAIVYELLLPALLEENGLSLEDFSWREKRKGLGPQLLGTADALKKALCEEIRRLKAFGKYEPADAKKITVRQPPLTCRIRRRNLTLSNPHLNAAQWENILQPFLDTEMLFARETEYRLTQSIFAPIRDALDRADLQAHEVDAVLLAGGSTRIPQVEDAIRSYFPRTNICRFDKNAEQTQFAISLGAAWHALFLEVMGRPLVQPVVHDTIALLIEKGGTYPLIPSGSAVPYPPDGGFERRTNLAVPEANVGELQMEVVAPELSQTLFSETWSLDRPVKAGEPITIEYRFTSNKEFQCRAYLTNTPEVVFARRVENPLTNTVSPYEYREEIEAIEEDIRSRGGPRPSDREALVRLAQLYNELKQHERAVDILNQALRVINRPDEEILMLLGLTYADLGRFEKAMKAYEDADKAGASWDGPMFDLALLCERIGKYDEALAAIERALKKPYVTRGPDATLKGLILLKLGREKEAFEQFQAARREFDHVGRLDDWQLGWAEICAQCLDDMAWQKAIEAQRKKRPVKCPEEPSLRRPILRGEIQKRTP